ncbi:histidine kinase dimerization/phospho-acceptor domain-containing protein [Tepidimicrobium xylanilyticum]|nr:histidine kinase dimerization/phospho-acceptor domain-containing protein [Tepidimicrobium xylanilyticum]
MELELRCAIANMSHDLRIPLTSILGYMQLLEDENLALEKKK